MEMVKIESDLRDIMDIDVSQVAYDQIMQELASSDEDWSVTEDESDSMFMLDSSNIALLDNKLREDPLAIFGLDYPVPNAPITDFFANNSVNMTSFPEVFGENEYPTNKKRKISSKQMLVKRAQSDAQRPRKERIKRRQSAAPVQPQKPKALVNAPAQIIPQENSISFEEKVESICDAKPKMEITKASRQNTCEFCLTQFDNLDSLKDHRTQHFHPEDDSFICTFPDCTKVYATGEGLRLHVRNVHLEAKHWKCLASECSRSFVRQSDLRMHIIRMHTSQRPCACPVTSCAKAFACHSELRRHVNSCHKSAYPKIDISKVSNKIDPDFVKKLMKKCD